MPATVIQRNASPEQLRAVFETMREGVLVVGSDGTVLRSNPAAEQILGLPPGSLQGRSALDPAWQPLRADGSAFPLDEVPIAIALRTGAAAPLTELGVRRADGGIAWIRASAQPMAEGGQQSVVVATFIDIAGEVEQREALRKTGEQLAFALDGSTDGYFDLNLTTGAMSFSPRWAAMFGYTLDELAPHASTCERLVHPDDQARSLHVTERHLRGDAPNFELEERMRHKDGHWVWVLARGKAVERDHDGTPLRLTGTFTDISARKAAEAALLERDAQLEAYFESPGVGVAVVGPDDRWTRPNQQLCSMLGYSREELASLTFQQVTHPEDAQLHGTLPAELLAGTRKSFTLDKRYIRKDGTNFWALTSVSCARLADGSLGPRVAVIKDISARKSAESALAASLAENQKIVLELQSALEEVKTLKALLPICMHCRKIRDEDGTWESLEHYISAHTDTQFSHGLCAECLEEHYPEM